MRLIDNFPHTRIERSPIHGQGLFTGVDVSEGQILAVLDGQVVNCHEHPEAFDMEWNALTEELLLVRNLKTKYAYINHSRDPNCRILNSDRSVRATRGISAGEELTLDYTADPLPPAYLALERTAFLRKDHR